MPVNSVMSNLDFELNGFLLNDRVCHANMVRFSGVCLVLKAVKFKDTYLSQHAIQYNSITNVEVSDVDGRNGCYIFAGLSYTASKVFGKFIDQSKGKSIVVNVISLLIVVLVLLTEAIMRLYINFKSQQQWDRFLSCLAPYMLHKFTTFSSIAVEDAQGKPLIVLTMDEILD